MYTTMYYIRDTLRGRWKCNVAVNTTQNSASSITASCSAENTNKGPSDDSASSAAEYLRGPSLVELLSSMTAVPGLKGVVHRGEGREMEEREVEESEGEGKGGREVEGREGRGGEGRGGEGGEEREGEERGGGKKGRVVEGREGRGGKGRGGEGRGEEGSRGERGEGKRGEGREERASTYLSYKHYKHTIV